MTSTLTRPETVRGYTRRDAMRDGVLVDVSHVARKVGFKHDMAVTQSVWLDSVYWDDDIVSHKVVDWIAQDTDSRLHDLVFEALLAAREHGGRRIEFTMKRTPIDTPGPQAQKVTLALTIGPGDDGVPVITLAMPDEV